MSDSDLQQDNGTPEFPATADVGTPADEYLIPTDDRVITADSNLSGDAPVNRALRRIRNLALGIRGAIVGDFSGAVRKTLKSLEVDGTGGSTSSIPAGDIKALGNVTAAAGDVLAPNGAVTAAGIIRSTGGSLTSDVADLIAGAVTSLVRIGLSPAQRTEIGNHFLRWLATGTGANDANPPNGTAMPNELRAINIEKVSTYCDMSAGNTFTSHDGFGLFALAVVALTSFPGKNGIRLTFVSAFADTNYQAVATVAADATHNAEFATEDLAMRTTSSCTFYFKNGVVSGGQLQFIDPAASPVNFSVKISGKQTT
jgi:hypothetical protein